MLQKWSRVDNEFLLTFLVLRVWPQFFGRFRSLTHLLSWLGLNWFLRSLRLFPIRRQFFLRNSLPISWRWRPPFMVKSSRWRRIMCFLSMTLVPIIFKRFHSAISRRWRSPIDFKRRGMVLNSGAVVMRIRRASCSFIIWSWSWSRQGSFQNVRPMYSFTTCNSSLIFLCDMIIRLSLISTWWPWGVSSNS